MFRVGITPDVLDPAGEPIFGSRALARLDGLDWEYLPRFEPLVSPATAARYDALCLMSGAVDWTTFASGGQRLRLIARFGVGYDSIDLAACAEQGVVVAIAPDGVRRPVAMSVLTLLLALAHKLLIKDRLTRQGRWQDKTRHIGVGLTGKTLGAIGLGNIGAEVFRLVQPFGMRHLAYDPYVDSAAARALGVELVALDRLLREADFLSVMCPLNERTRGLIGERALAAMKPTAYLINTARGPIVDEAALCEALRAGRLAGAGLDVFAVEPTPSDNPLLALDNVIVSPHGLCFTDECLEGLANSAFSAVAALAAGRAPAHVVNPAALDHPALAGLSR